MSRGLCHWCVPGDPYRSTVSNKIHARLFELGIRDPELFRLLRKLDNIEKVEKGMTEDRPSFF